MNVLHLAYFKNLDWLGSEQRIRMLTTFNKYKVSTGNTCSEEFKFSKLSVYYHLAYSLLLSTSFCGQTFWGNRANLLAAAYANG